MTNESRDWSTFVSRISAVAMLIVATAADGATAGLTPFTDAFRRVSSALVTAYIKYATSYQTDPPTSRSGGEQENDDTYSPLGLRDQEYRAFLFIRSAGTLFGAAGAMGAASLAKVLIERPNPIYEWVIAVLLAPVFTFGIFIGIVTWTSTSGYPETRRLNR